MWPDWQRFNLSAANVYSHSLLPYLPPTKVVGGVHEGRAMNEGCERGVPWEGGVNKRVLHILLKYFSCITMPFVQIDTNFVSNKVLQQNINSFYYYHWLCMIQWTTNVIILVHLTITKERQKLKALASSCMHCYPMFQYLMNSRVCMIRIRRCGTYQLFTKWNMLYPGRKLTKLVKCILALIPTVPHEYLQFFSFFDTTRC